MKTLSFKISAPLEETLALSSQQERVSKSELVRRALLAYAAQHSSALSAQSALGMAGDLVGCFSDAPPDLASNPVHLADLDSSKALALIERGVIQVGMTLTQQMTSVSALYQRYDNVPSSLADACLVRMSELYEPCHVLTLDSDFHIYRRHGRKTIPRGLPIRLTALRSL